MPDFYFTIYEPSKAIFKEKGSKFLAFAYPVRNEDEIREYLEAIKKDYHDARHHCYAWVLGGEGENYRANDDGEPSNTAGKPILGQIRSFGLTNILIIVVRYFGGTLLGVGGLISAYKTASRDALSEAKIKKVEFVQTYTLFFTYEHMNTIMRVVKELNLSIVEQKFENDCSFKLVVRKKDVKRFEIFFKATPEIKIVQEKGKSY